MKEEELLNNIALLQNGSQSAFEKIYNAYSDALFGLCLKVVNDQGIAEDVLQEAFVKIWKNAKKYDAAKGTFFTWMLNIARNTAIDKYRKIKKNPTEAIQDNESNVYHGSNASQSISINHIGLKDILKGLPEEQQTIIEYLYFKGYTQKETSEELDLPLGTVKTRSRTALKSLREIFIILLAWM